MDALNKPDQKELDLLKQSATRLRKHSVIATNASGSGHPTSCASIAEIMAVLHFRVMRYSLQEPRAAAADRFVLSKGHAAPILYACWAEAGLFPTSELLQLRKITSDLEGHPTPRLPFVDVGTGSLGQGLSIACGMAYAGKYVDKAAYRTFCLLGDGETAEGSVWEAFNFASYYKLDNLVAVIDVNRLGQSDPTSLQHQMDVYQARLEAFGWNVIVLDGHDVEALCQAFDAAAQAKGKPTCVIAKTYKGKGFPGIEDEVNWHGKPLGAKAEDVIAALDAQLKDSGAGDAPEKMPIRPMMVADCIERCDMAVTLSTPPAYSPDQRVQVRQAYGTALVKLAQKNNRVVALDGDTKNSTFSQKLMEAFPDRYVECFIAEQNLAGVGMGMACRDRAIVFISSFAAFFTRAFDQLRMGAISQTNVNVVGSHAGVSIGEDGPSQMALEDLAMFRSIPTCTVFYPSDAVSCERAVELAANTPGMTFIRATRGETRIMYSAEQEFHVGKAHVLRQTDNDQVTVVGAGVTMEAALVAYDALKLEGINVRVLDPFTIKPLDAEAVRQAARATGGRVVTVEDHYPEGGLGDAVLEALALERGTLVRKLAVRDVPRSGKSAELLAKYAIDAAAIQRAVKEILPL